MVAIGTLVSFRFTVERYEFGRGSWYERRSGRGIIVADNDFSVWPVGYTLRVTDSADYPTGEIVHVSSETLT